MAAKARVGELEGDLRRRSCAEEGLKMERSKLQRRCTRHSFPWRIGEFHGLLGDMGHGGAERTGKTWIIIEV